MGIYNFKILFSLLTYFLGDIGILRVEAVVHVRLSGNVTNSSLIER